jgi:hypothetical protein
MGSYSIDSHHVQRFVTKDKEGRSHVQNEGDIKSPIKEPYAISYDAIVPPLEECSNLLIPVCLSASHVAFSSLRTEPVFMVLGQSAATAAVLALDEEIPVQGVDYSILHKKLLEGGQILALNKKSRLSTGVGVPVSKLGGVVVDGDQLIRTGEWTKSSSLRPFVGSSYYHDGNGG